MTTKFKELTFTLWLVASTVIPTGLTNAASNTGVKSVKHLCQALMDNGMYQETLGTCMGDFSRQFPENCSDETWLRFFERYFNVELKSKGDCIVLWRKLVNDRDFTKDIPSSN